MVVPVEVESVEVEEVVRDRGGSEAAVVGIATDEAHRFVVRKGQS